MVVLGETDVLVKATARVGVLGTTTLSEVVRAALVPGVVRIESELAAESRTSV